MRAGDSMRAGGSATGALPADHWLRPPSPTARTRRRYTAPGARPMTSIVSPPIAPLPSVHGPRAIEAGGGACEDGFARDARWKEVAVDSDQLKELVLGDDGVARKAEKHDERPAAKQPPAAQSAALKPAAKPERAVPAAVKKFEPLMQEVLAAKWQSDPKKAESAAFQRGFRQGWKALSKRIPSADNSP